MIDNTISDDVTMSGAAGTLLAGRYRVVRQLGQGGMGSVWLAEDQKLDGHKVAIKMLPSILVRNKRAYNQLKAEALVSLKLTHPNIATVRAFEENDGNPFLVMDYIDGLTLDEYLAKKGKLSEETVYALLEPVARALDYAHEKGVVHRDVKPGNVMVTWDGNPFVLDFGIAREIQETMTRVTGKLSSGTLLYMSPEQLKGGSPKPAQDVYSFAAMAYECLKGEPPFSRGQIEWQIMNEPPEPLLGGTLAASVMRGLAKDPAQRPSTCRGVLVASRPAARPSFGPPRATAEPPKPARVTPANKAEPSLDLRGLLIRKGRVPALVAAGVVVVLLAIWNAGSDSPAEPPASGEVKSPPAPTEERVDMGELDKTRIEAQVKVAACRRLDKGDGFAAKIEECENDLVRAKAEYELKRWGDAHRSYKAVLERSVALMALDSDREKALEAAEKMEQQARAAKAAEADRYAVERFNAAKELIIQAKDAFAEMRFAVAAAKHEFAARQFELSIGEAKAEIVRLAEEKRKAEEAAAAEAERRKNWRQETRPFTIADEGLGLTMKWCPPGSFELGSPENEEGRGESERQLGVTLTKGFWMGETEVTQGQWKKLMDGETIHDLARKMLADDTPVNYNGTWKFMRDHYRRGATDDPRNICGDIDDEAPVYHVSWDEAMAFCRRLTDIEQSAGRIPDGYEYRLPTEAEWEYACRATTTSALPNGLPFHAAGVCNAPALDDIAWYSGNSSVGFSGRGWLTDSWKEKQYPGGRAAPRHVKGKGANKWGLFDMLGNVCEWCADIAVQHYDQQTDPRGARRGAYRSFRGGGWGSEAVHCRPASRLWMAANYRCESLGFRVALAPQYADFPYESEPLTGDALASALEKARHYHDSLQSAQKPSEERADSSLPILRVTTNINGEEVYGAKVKIKAGVKEGFEQTTPFRIWARFTQGDVVGPFEASYEKDGVRYSGTMSAITVDWTGVKNLGIPLATVPTYTYQTPVSKPADDLDALLKDLEKTGPKPRAASSLNFCRHCGTKIADSSNVWCPVCGRNIFGN